MIKCDKNVKTVDGPLQLGLSGIINTITTNETINIKDYLGEGKFQDLANIMMKKDMNKRCFDDHADAIVKTVLNSYDEGGIVGARKYIYKKKLELLDKDGYTIDSIEVKIFDIFTYLGEAVSQATKNEMLDALSTSSFGRRIDMLVMTQSEDGEEGCVELSANEHKKGDAEFELVTEQQSKNIVTNICILSQLRKRFGVDINVNCSTNPLIMDVIGLRAYLYSVARTEDVFVASKVSNNYVVLPTSLADFDEFIEQESMYLLLNYSKYIIDAANDIVGLMDKTTKRRFETIMNDQVDKESPRIFFADNKKPKTT
ncbi:hypothetical protein BDB00DRAFT_872556 [Zychaea mexicana]|nr:uncharacterized protein BDB00DRAFT_872556 [Zychaea mexicana]KAI9493251.1 hypothetical protein BDB00DRAFT_872556 [Zychaea mexicana]